MTTFRKFIYYFVAFIAFLMLLQVPFAFAASSLFSNPDTVSNGLKESGLYENATNLALDNVADKTTDETTKSLVTDNEFRQELRSTVKEEDLEAAFRPAIDGVYAWLEGKTETPEFAIDLSKPAESAKTAIDSFATQRAESLPTCTLSEIPSVNLDGDLLKVPCLPPGVPSSLIGQRFVANAEDNTEFLREPQVSSDQLFEAGDVTREQIASSNFPQVYQNVHDSKWYNLIVLLLVISLLIFARRNRTAGVKVVSILLLVSATFVGLMVLTFTAGSADTANLAINEQIAAKALFFIAEELGLVARWFALGYFIIGLALLGYSRRKTEDLTPPQVTAS